MISFKEYLTENSGHAVLDSPIPNGGRKPTHTEAERISKATGKKIHPDTHKLVNHKEAGAGDSEIHGHVYRQHKHQKDRYIPTDIEVRHHSAKPYVFAHRNKH